MIGVNEVRLAGHVSRIYPVKHFDQQNCMLIAEITTTDEAGTFAHRVSFINADAISFSKNAQIGANITIDGKLTPRPKNRDNPNGETFFEIRCMRYFFVAESPIQVFDAATVYPESLQQPQAAPAEKSMVKRMLGGFSAHKQLPNVQPEPMPPIENNEPLLKQGSFAVKTTSFKA